MDFVHVEGTQETKPLSFDATTSKTVIYIRKNIEQITKVDEQTGDCYKVWSYDEAIISVDDFDAVSSAFISSLTDENVEQSTEINDLGDAIIEMSEIVYA